jgi:hypothetical protein
MHPREEGHCSTPPTHQSDPGMAMMTLDAFVDDGDAFVDDFEEDIFSLSCVNQESPRATTVDDTFREFQDMENTLRKKGKTVMKAVVLPNDTEVLKAIVIDKGKKPRGGKQSRRQKAAAKPKKSAKSRGRKRKASSDDEHEWGVIDEVTGMEVRSDDEDDDGEDLKGFIVNSDEDDVEISDEEKPSKSNPLSGVDPSNIITGKRRRKPAKRYVHPDYWKMMTKALKPEEKAEFEEELRTEGRKKRRRLRKVTSESEDEKGDDINESEDEKESYGKEIDQIDAAVEAVETMEALAAVKAYESSNGSSTDSDPHTISISPETKEVLMSDEVDVEEDIEEEEDSYCSEDASSDGDFVNTDIVVPTSAYIDSEGDDSDESSFEPSTGNSDESEEFSDDYGDEDDGEDDYEDDGEDEEY